MKWEIAIAEAERDKQTDDILFDVFNLPRATWHSAAIEALGKQVGKKPRSVSGRPVCASCWLPIKGPEDLPNYCQNCGQKINWQEDSK